MTRHSILSCAVAGLVMALAGAPVAANEVKTLGEFKDWTAYEGKDAGQSVCYMVSKPKKSEGKYKSRDEVYLMVTHRPAEKARDIVSVIAGYTYKTDSEVKLTVGDKSFRLFTQGGNAWAESQDADRAVAAALRSGTTAVVNGVSGRGNDTVDTYSLNGAGAAYKAISDACWG